MNTTEDRGALCILRVGAGNAVFENIGHQLPANVDLYPDIRVLTWGKRHARFTCAGCSLMRDVMPDPINLQPGPGTITPAFAELDPKRHCARRAC